MPPLNSINLNVAKNDLSEDSNDSALAQKHKSVPLGGPLKFSSVPQFGGIPVGGGQTPGGPGPAFGALGGFRNRF